MIDSEACQEHKASGNALFAKGEHASAAAAYTAALQASPCAATSAVLLSNRAACHLQLGKPQQALEDAQAAVEADPEYHKALLRLAAAHAGLGQLLKAQRAAKRGAEEAKDPALRAQLAKAASEYKRAVDAEVFGATQEVQGDLRESRGRDTGDLKTPFICAGCSAVDKSSITGAKRFRECRRCRSVAYCSVECAASHWYDGHKPVCDELKRKRDPIVASGFTEKEVGGAACENALQAFAVRHPEHWNALQVLAFVLQHMADPPWGGAPGPVQLEVLNVQKLSSTKPLIVTAWPLTLYKEHLLPKVKAESDTQFVQDLISGLERVDVDVGFMLILPTIGALASTAVANPRVRYSFLTGILMQLARCAEANGCITIGKGVPVMASIDTPRFVAAWQQQHSGAAKGSN